MNRFAAARMRRRPAFSLREIADFWAPELRLHPQLLAEQLLEAMANGEFDTIPSPEGPTHCGAVNIDGRTGECWRIVGAKLPDLFAQLAAQESDVRLAQVLLIEKHMLGLSREAIWHFCRTNKIAPPSILPMPAMAKRAHANRTMPSSQRRQEIMAFLLNTPRKATTVPEMERAVMSKFNVPRTIARERIKQLPSDQKLSRGEKRRKSAG